jgi:hypothetical protein
MKLIAAMLILATPVFADGNDTNLIAEITATVTNLLSLPTDQGIAKIKTEAQLEWFQVEADMSNGLAQANQHLLDLQAGKSPDRKFILNADQSNIVAQVKAERDRSRARLQAIRRRMWARIQALENLKKSAEPATAPYPEPATRSPKR